MLDGGNLENESKRGGLKDIILKSPFLMKC